MTAERTIGIAGAGSIGCFVGGMLAAGGRQVALLARPRVIAEIESNGLRLTSFEGLDRRIAADQLTLSENPSIFSDAGVVLVTVKSADTAEMAGVIARHAPHDAVIVSACRTASAMSACCASDCRDGSCWAAWCRSTWSRWARAGFIAPPRATS